MIKFFLVIYYSINKKNLLQVKLYSKHNIIMPALFAVLVTWTVFAAIPYFRFNGPYPQVDTQIVFLHFLCGIMFFYFAINLMLSKTDKSASLLIKSSIIYITGVQIVYVLDKLLFQ